MRGYTLSLLTKISGNSAPVNDRLITDWANSRVSIGRYGVIILLWIHLFLTVGNNSHGSVKIHNSEDI